MFSAQVGLLQGRAQAHLPSARRSAPRALAEYGEHLVTPSTVSLLTFRACSAGMPQALHQSGWIWEGCWERARSEAVEA